MESLIYHTADQPRLARCSPRGLPAWEILKRHRADPCPSLPFQRQRGQWEKHQSITTRIWLGAICRSALTDGERIPTYVTNNSVALGRSPSALPTRLRPPCHLSRPATLNWSFLSAHPLDQRAGRDGDGERFASFRFVSSRPEKAGGERGIGDEHHNR